MIEIRVKAVMGDVIVEVAQTEGGVTQVITCSHDEAIELRDKMQSGLKILAKRFDRPAPKIKNYKCKPVAPDGGTLYES